MEYIYFHINNSSQEEKLLSGIFLSLFFFFWEKTKAFKAHKKKWKLKNTNKFFKQINKRENETL